jgi:hypothetical protein
MLSNETRLLDPTAELSPVNRQRLSPPPTLDAKKVALLDIGKARGDVFIDRLQALFADHGVQTQRYAKPTNTRVAPSDVVQSIADECDVVVEALSD